jgi:Na+-transporting methylmalonyl-CoA/oxaloacetate decarboxylase beta subunit
MARSSMIVASWANVMLYTLEIAMGLQLVARKPQKKRDLVLEVLPAIVLLIDTVGTVCVSILLYLVRRITVVPLVPADTCAAVVLCLTLGYAAPHATHDRGLTRDLRRRGFTR